MEKFIEINNLNYFYGTNRVLHDISFFIEKENFVSIIGPNGSGKTTLLKILVKLLHINNNHVYLFEKDINDYSIKTLSKTISYVPQFTNIDFDFTVMDVLLLGRHPYLNFTGQNKDKDYNICYDALKLIESENLKDKSVNKLSGGERQKVFIAKALVQNTDVIVLDEPISSLDLHNQIEILDILKKLTVEQNKKIILVLHDINMAMSYSDYIIMLKEGIVYSKGYPEEVITEANISKCFNVNVEVIENRYIKTLSKFF